MASRLVPRFLDYAGAFERAYASGDWQQLAPFLAEDACYQVRASERLRTVQRGRPAVLAYFDWITQRFDKQFAERKLVPFDPPREANGAVVLRGAAVYRLADGERCHLALTETAHYRDARIERLVDELRYGTCAELEHFLDRHPERFPYALGGPASG